MTSKDPTQVLVTGHGNSYAQKIQARGHELRADEPVDLGGEDTGPNPYELLLSALGACTNITLTMYAKRKRWPLEDVQVALSHQKIHADDCASCTTEKGLLDHIERKLSFTGPLDQEQRERLLEIANKCPVHRTLEGEIHVTTSLAEA